MNWGGRGPTIRGVWGQSPPSINKNTHSCFTNLTSAEVLAMAIGGTAAASALKKEVI